MFNHGLESLLRQEANFNIVGQERELDQALEQIKELQPEVVILESDDRVPQVTQILHASPNVRVISLSLQNNDLHIFQAKQWIARETEDLVKAIKDDLPDTNPPVRRGSNY